MPPPPDTGAPLVVQRCYELALWVLQKAEKLPRNHKFTLGDRLVNQTLDLLGLLVEAAYAKEKSALLEEANRKINSLRYLLRLCKDIKVFSVDAYGFAVTNLDEVGRMVGGWRKARS